ncbi:ankyrin repeat-containing domain protein [Biscogniauxia sp. FL1348]|nr:ankyrin repeat-containing domain protein [Biscogniauxia sp. FL1348]
MAERNKDWFDIARSCNNLVFFGTPHRPSSASSWEDLLMNILLVSLGTTPKRLANNMMRRMRSLSSFLEDLSTRFSSIPTRRCIVNVCEQIEKTDQINTVVDSYSATTGQVHEIRISRVSEHNDACKLGNDDPILSIILDSLQGETDIKYRACLSNLFNISSPVLDPEVQLSLYALGPWDTIELPSEYKNWLDSPTPPIITSCGPKGSGKGLCSRVLFRNVQDRSYTAAYFSFASNNSCRASFRALLSSVMFQIFTQQRETYTAVEALYTTIKDIGAWTQGGLLALFQALLDMRKSQDPLYLIIDGLHQCDSSWKQLLSVLLVVLSEDHSRIKLKVALFYQNCTEISDALRALEQFCMQGPLLAEQSLKAPLVALASHMIEDNSYYTRSEPHVSAALEKCKDITDLLLTTQSLDDLVSPRTFKSVTEILPRGVSNVVPGRYRGLQMWARLALGWIVHAKRPLTLDELATAVALTEQKNGFITSFDSQGLPIDTAAEVKLAFGHLIRLESGSIFFSTDKIRDEFIELITKEDAQAEKEIPETAIPGDTQITRILLHYLSMPQFLDFSNMLHADGHILVHEPLFNLARYAVQFWPVHYHAAAKLNPDKANLLEFIENNNNFFHTWSKIYARVDFTALPPDVAISNPLLLTAQLGVTDIFAKLKGPDTETTHCNDAIKLASWSGHAEIVGILLQDTREKDLGSLTIALEYASARGHVQIVKQLLEHIQIVEGLSLDHLEKLDKWATQLRYNEQTALFRNFVNHRDDYITQLFIYIIKGDQNAIEKIIDHLTHSDNEGDMKLIDSVKGPEGRTPLMVACIKKRTKIVKLLIERGARSTIVDSEGYTALYYSIHKDEPALADIIIKSASSLSAFKDVVKAFFRATACKLSKTFRKHLDSSVRFKNKTLKDIPDEEAVHYAIKWRFRDVVSHFWDDMTDPNQKDSEGMSLLELAGLNANIEAMKYLVRRGAKPDREATVVLQVARSSEILSDHPEAVKILLEAGVNPNKRSSTGKSALHMAAKRNKIEIVRVLLKMGVDVNLKCRRGWNALHYVANYATVSRDISELLVQAGTETSVDVDSWLPVHLAATSGNTNLLEVLYKYNRDCLKETDPYERTPLHFACNTPKSLRWLLDHGVAINAVDIRGETALMSAFNYGSEESIRILMRARGADLAVRDISGRTVLYHAVNAGALDLGRELLTKNINILSCRDECNLSALHFAIRSGQSKFAEMLLGDFYSKATENSLRDLGTKAKSDGETPLISAVKRDQHRVIQRLLQLGAETESRDENGRTALLAAVDRRDESTIELLLGPDAKHPVDVNAGDAQYPSALHEAARNGHLALVEKLVFLGASVNAVGGKYKTALRAAAFAGFDKIVQFLLEKEADASLHSSGDNPGVLKALLNRHPLKKSGTYGKSGVAWQSFRQAAAAH